MGLIDNIKRAFGSSRPAEHDTSYVAASIRLSDEVSSSTRVTINAIDYARVSRAITGSIYNAAMIMAMECASQPIKLYRVAGASKTGKARKIGRKTSKFLRGKGMIRPSAKAVSLAGEEEIEEVYEHPVLDLLADPDPVTTSSDFFTLLYWYREVAGKCFIWMGEKIKGRPSGLYILHPQYTVPQLSSTEYITGYKYGRETTRPVEYAVEDVIYSRYAPDPFRPWDAMSWLSSVELYGDMENAALVSEIARWKNGGLPGTILKVPQSWTDTQCKQAEAAIKANGGPLKSGRALVLKDAELIQSQSKPHEMGYIAGLEQAEKAIYRAAGIPEAMWKLNDANLASAKTASPQFLRSAYGRMKRVAEDFTEYLLPMYGETGMWFGYENPVTEDAESDSALLDRGWNSGYVYLNEARAALDLDPVEEEQDTLGKATPVANNPFGGVFNANQPKSEVQTGGGGDNGQPGDGGAPDTGTAGNTADVANDPNGQGKGSAPGARYKAGRVELIAVPRWGALDGCGCGKAHKAGPADDVEQSMFRAVQAWAEDALKRGIAGIQPDGTFNLSAMASNELQALLNQAITAAFEQGAVSMIAEAGVDTEPLTSQAARDYIQSYQFDLVSGITETMADQMRTTIDAGLEQGKTINQIQQELVDKVPEVSMARAETIARTETARASQNGALEQAKELGFEGKQWLLSGNPCGLCEGAAAALAGTTTPINEPFFAAGTTIAGTDGKVYTLARPVMAACELHPNCNCTHTTVQEVAE